MTGPYAALAALLAQIEAHDHDYPTRYGLVLQALAAARAADLSAGIGYDHAEHAVDGYRVVVYLELPTGQVSWHMPEHPTHFDGHSTAAKYQRIAAFDDLASASACDDDGDCPTA